MQEFEFVSIDTNPIEEFTIVEIIEKIFGPEYWMNPLSIGEETKILLDYCKENNLYLYERYSDNYCESEGYTHAVDWEYDGVIYSNLG